MQCFDCHRFLRAAELRHEVMQYDIPRRGSGIIDVITNTVGAALGATLLQWSFVRNVMQRARLIPRVGPQEVNESTHKISHRSVAPRFCDSLYPGNGGYWALGSR